MRLSGSKIRRFLLLGFWEATANRCRGSFRGKPGRPVRMGVGEALCFTLLRNFAIQDTVKILNFKDKK